MEEIQHRTVDINGIKMHIAEKGQGPVVLLLHGFPELWYSWRHQILALARHGYRAVAPDLRGYGDSDAPSSIHSYSILLSVGDIIGLIDYLGVEQVFLVGHDWGAGIAWGVALFRPERVKAMVNLSVPFSPRDPSMKPIERYRAFFGDDLYICRFQEPGEMEAEIASAGVERALKKFFTSFGPGPLIIPKGTWLGDSNTPISLPSWLSEEDVKYFASRFEQKGFTGPLNYYRMINRDWELVAPWAGAEVKVPTRFIVGSKDSVYSSPGLKEYVHGATFKKFVPLLEEVVVIDGAGHFINQERPEDISTHIYEFIKKF
ncbi:hypothetical protein Scep_008993 [Stephania cephalantha]|uniref:soluble epoxide hydrolase n=1 Tax=Stephania cephalantha TaxID=152367 RepID=A0AAP0PCP7_9MAGN